MKLLTRSYEEKKTVGTPFDGIIYFIVDGDRCGFANKRSGLYFEPTQIYVEIQNSFHSSQENKLFSFFRYFRNFLRILSNFFTSINLLLTG